MNAFVFPVDLSMVIVDKDSLANQCLNFVLVKWTFYFQFLLSHPALILLRQSMALDCSIRREKRTSGEVLPEYLKSLKRKKIR